MAFASVALLACDHTVERAGTVRAVDFDSAFQIVGRITLAETSEDLIGDIGIFREMSDGGFLISDAIEPRIRRYAADGSLIDAFGDSGAGPFEFERIGGVAELDSSSIIVVDPTLARVTVLTSDLNPDTLFEVSPRQIGRAHV